MGYPVRPFLRQTEPAPDYAAPYHASSRRSVSLAILEGAGSVFAPFQGLNDIAWWAAPQRDQVLIGGDLWGSLWQYESESTVHPDQSQLFDPAQLGS